MSRIRLEEWTADDLVVLERNDVPEMTAYLGGPEGPEKLGRRQERFLREQTEGTAHPFTVHAEGTADAVGSVVYWDTEHEGRQVYECGWATSPGHQGHGYASDAVRLMLRHAAEHGARERVYAFPRVDNTAPNALASTVGFEFEGEQGFEYPAGVPIRVNAWWFDLGPLRAGR